MAKGKDTRQRILEAALEVFAQRGYEGATVAEICKHAGANVAAVNYYFGDKASLYREVWAYAYSLCPAVPSVDPEAPPEEQLRQFVKATIMNFHQKGPQGHFTRLYLMEFINPTGLIQPIWNELAKPKRDMLLDIIRRIMGKDRVDEQVIFSELSVINQCRVLLTIRPVDLEYLLGQCLDREVLEELADHIAEFSLGGIRAVCRPTFAASQRGNRGWG